MANDRQNLLAKEMAELRKQFHGQLLTDLKSLSANGNETGPELSPAMLVTLRDTCHRLAGSTLTFGYNSVGNALRALEHQLNAALQADDINPTLLRESLKDLQRFESALSPDLPAGQDESSGNAPVDETDNFRLYVLEDELANAELLRSRLASFGYQVTVFSHEDELRQACNQHKPDALIVDIAIDADNEKSHLHIDTDLHSITGSSVPILVISDYDGFQEKLMAARCGASAFFTKPVNIPELETQLDYLLRQRVKTAYRVLLVDDDPFSLAHYRLLLQATGTEVRTLTNPADIFDAIDEFQPELLVFDLHMPDCSGIELAQTVRFHPQWIHIPIIYLSAEQNENQQMSALLKGGDGFLTKPVTDNVFRKL